MANAVSSGPRGGGSSATFNGPLFTDLRGAEETVAELKAAFESFRWHVVRDVKLIYNGVLDITARTEASLREVNEDTIELCRDIATLRLQVNRLESELRQGCMEELTAQPVLMPPSSFQTATLSCYIEASPPSASATQAVSTASGLIVADSTLPPTASNLCPLGNRREGTVAKGELVRPGGSGPSELLSEPEVLKTSDFGSISDELLVPAQRAIQKNGPGPRCGNLNTVMRRMKRQRQAARRREESVRGSQSLSSLTVAVHSETLERRSPQSSPKASEGGCILEVKEQPVVRRVQLTPTLPRASVPSTELEVRASEAACGQAMAGQKAALPTDAKAGRGDAVWFGARDVRLKQNPDAFKQPKDSDKR